MYKFPHEFLFNLNLVVFDAEFNSLFVGISFMGVYSKKSTISSKIRANFKVLESTWYRDLPMNFSGL